MQIAEHIEIKVDNKTVAFLSPNDGLKDVYADGRINGEYTLEFSLPANSEKIKELTPECEIYANFKVYNLLKDEATETVMDEQGRLWTKFMAVERWKDLDTDFVEPYISNDPTIPSPADLAVIIVGGGNDLSGGMYTVGTAAHALYAALNGSDWTMGVCDVTGLHDIETEKASRLQLIKLIQATWGGILIWDSVNKVVHLRDEDTYQVYRGLKIKYAKNLKHITRTQSNRLITKLYCFGADDLDIASVNGGVKYLTDFSYTTREYTGVYSNPDIEDAEELKQKGLAELALNCKPRYKYSVKVVDLGTLGDLYDETIRLGEMADIVNYKLEVDERVRIIRHRYNLFQPWICELELGDPLERFIEKLKTSFETSDLINNTFDSSGRLPGWKLVDGSVINNKIANAALDASKFNTKQIILTGDVWNDNSPLNGSVAWNSHKLFFGGVEYSIIGGNTNKKYIIWRKDISPTTYQAYTEEEFASISLKDYDFVIAVNNGGLHDIAWYNRLARQFIGSVFIADAAIKEANIANLAVTDAKIANMTASKLTAGIIKATGAIYLGDTSFALVAADKQLVVKDTQTTPKKRVIVGYNSAESDYGIWVYDSSSKEILGASGLGVNVVGTNQLINGSVTDLKIDSVSANKITAGTITALISIESPKIYSGIYYGPSSSSAFAKVGGSVSSAMGDFALYRGGATPSEVFKIYDDATQVLMYALGSSILRTIGSTTYPKGTWDFSESTIAGVNTVAKFA